MNKSLTTLNPPPPQKKDGSRQEQWEEFRSVFPIYVALAKQLQFEIPIAPNKRVLPEKADSDLFAQIQTWLDSMDQRVLVYQLRQLLQMTTLNASESGLRALIHRHLRKTTKSSADRDKIDFLLVQYFALCAPPKIYHKQIELADVAQVMKPVFGEVHTVPLSWCEPLDQMIQSLRGLRCLREILKTNFIEQGRKVKESAGGMFYDPCAMITFVRFNFLLRRTIIELMHADLIAIRAGLAALEAASVHLIDCHHLGLTGTEPVSKILEMASEWKQPFQKEYTERSVNQAFEKLLGLRSDVDAALARLTGKATAPLIFESVVPASPTTQGHLLSKTDPQSGPGLGAKAENQRSASAQTKSTAPAAEVLDFDTCTEKIWEQLIAAPPSRGRSMTTIRLGGARILLSSWEVSAFVSEDGPSAQDLRRAVVARALVTAATEVAKETGNATGLDLALSIARAEVSRLQERVDIAKKAKDTEAAVNLGISSKRLVSALDEAEKL
ncbi:MAG: hypothetical protein PVS2B2_16960 [Candidatus Acidiferrum sp.]